jgi:hypothetical protein
MASCLELARRTLARLRPAATTIRCPWCFGIMLTDAPDGLWCDACQRLAWVELRAGCLIRADHISDDVIALPDPCGTCGSLMRWQSLAGRWRCLECDPPARSRQLSAQATRLRNRHRLA